MIEICNWRQQQLSKNNFGSFSNMGNKNSQQCRNLLANWQQHPNEADVLMNLVTNEQVHRYFVMVVDSQEIGIYNNRQHEHYSYICRVVYFHPQNSYQMVSPRLLQKKVPQSFYIYTQLMRPVKQWNLDTTLMAMKGFRRLFSTHGPFRVDSSMIGQNQRGEVKVWVNSSPVLNHPDKIASSEQQMLADLAAILIHRDKKSAGLLIACKTFTQVIRNLNELQHEQMREMEQNPSNSAHHKNTFQLYSYRQDLEYDKFKDFKERKQEKVNADNKKSKYPLKTPNNDSWTLRKAPEDRSPLYPTKYSKRPNNLYEQTSANYSALGLKNKNSGKSTHGTMSLDKNYLQDSKSANQYAYPGKGNYAAEYNHQQSSISPSPLNNGSSRNSKNEKPDYDSYERKKYNFQSQEKRSYKNQSSNPIQTFSQGRNYRGSHNEGVFPDQKGSLQQTNRGESSYSNPKSNFRANQYFKKNYTWLNREQRDYNAGNHQIQQDPNQEHNSPLPCDWETKFPGQQGSEQGCYHGNGFNKWGSYNLYTGKNTDEQLADRNQTFNHINKALKFHQQANPIRNKTQDFNKCNNVGGDVPSFIPRRRQQPGDNLSKDIKALSSKQRLQINVQKFERTKLCKVSQTNIQKKKTGVENNAWSQKQYKESYDSKLDRNQAVYADRNANDKCGSRNEETSNQKFLHTMEEYGMAGCKKDSNPYRRNNEYNENQRQRNSNAHTQQKQQHRHSNSNAEKANLESNGRRDRDERSEGDADSHKDDSVGNRSLEKQFGQNSNANTNTITVTSSEQAEDPRRKYKHEIAQQLKQEFGSILSWNNQDANQKTVPAKKERPESKYSQDSSNNAFKHNRPHKEIVDLGVQEAERKEKVQNIITKYNGESLKDSDIKEKVEKKKATFAQLKKEAMKILSDELF